MDEKGDMMELIHGDCLTEMMFIDDGSIDMVLTDPPYGTTACKWDSVIPLEPMWEHLKRIIKPNGAIVMTASQPFTTTLIASNMKMFKYCWVWKKQKPTNFYQVRWQPLKEHEDIAVFCKAKPYYYPQGTKSVNVKSGRKNKSSNLYSQYDGGDYIQKTGNYPRSIQEVPTEGDKGRLHPTQKPVALMEYLIKTYTNEGDRVLDFTMGSGSTGVACKNLSRDFIGIEKDLNYFEIAKKRINETL
jgi:site-specific DNA-methyltransferase (adenine-specific)